MSSRWGQNELVGNYHLWKIKNQFPIPGSALTADVHRRVAPVQPANLEAECRAQHAQSEKLLQEKQAVYYKDLRRPGRSSTDTLFEKLEDLMHEKEQTAIQYEFAAQDGEPVEHSSVFDLVRANNVEALNRRFLKGQVNLREVDSESQNTALMLASRLGFVDVIKVLLRYGSDPNYENIHGHVALHLAWDSWLKEINHPVFKAIKLNTAVQLITELLQYGAEPDCAMHNGKTPLHLAAGWGHAMICALLLRYKATPDLRDRTGQTPLDLATKRGHKECCGLLVNAATLGDVTRQREFFATWHHDMQARTAAAKLAAKTKLRGGGQKPATRVIGGSFGSAANLGVPQTDKQLREKSAEDILEAFRAEERARMLLNDPTIELAPERTWMDASVADRDAVDGALDHLRSQSHQSQTSRSRALSSTSGSGRATYNTEGLNTKAGIGMSTLAELSETQEHDGSGGREEGILPSLSTGRRSLASDMGEDSDVMDDKRVRRKYMYRREWASFIKYDPSKAVKTLDEAIADYRRNEALKLGGGKPRVKKSDAASGKSDASDTSGTGQTMGDSEVLQAVRRRRERLAKAVAAEHDVHAKVKAFGAVEFRVKSSLSSALLAPTRLRVDNASKSKADWYQEHRHLKADGMMAVSVNHVPGEKQEFSHVVPPRPPPEHLTPALLPAGRQAGHTVEKTHQKQISQTVHHEFFDQGVGLLHRGQDWHWNKDAARMIAAREETRGDGEGDGDGGGVDTTQLSSISNRGESVRDTVQKRLAGRKTQKARGTAYNPFGPLQDPWKSVPSLRIADHV